VDQYFHQVAEASDYLRARMGAAPVVGLLTGTGLGDSVRSMQTENVFDYDELPYFPVSTVAGHAGRLICGRLSGRAAMVMQGRFHLYEGYSPREVTFPIRVMRELGVSVLILTNAAGGLNPSFRTGDIMIIRDHINLTGANPLTGPNQDHWGLRFPDMTRAYAPELAALAENALPAETGRLQQGIYAGLKGPSLETPAEVRFLRAVGADAVGFSTVQEVIAAVHAGMAVLGLSTITNINDPDHPTPATVEAIIEAAASAAPALDGVIRYVVEHLDAQFSG
jgi:purine-nucleoside phosphorylase